LVPAVKRLAHGMPEIDAPAVLVGATLSPESGAFQHAAGVVLLAPSLAVRDRVKLALAGQERVWLDVIPDPSAGLLAERTLHLLLGVANGLSIGAATVGLLGFRSLGWKLAAALTALDAQVRWWSPATDRREMEEQHLRALRTGARNVEFDDLLASCDVLVVDLPDDPDIGPLLGRAELALMPDDAVIANTTSSTAIDDGALIQTLRGGYLRGVALGRTNLEPLLADSPLRTLERVMLSLQGPDTDDRQVRRLLAGRLAQALAARPELDVELRRVRHVRRRIRRDGT
jgi:phosphoglycerate dehydrogenase-like enzyme